LCDEYIKQIIKFMTYLIWASKIKIHIRLKTIETININSFSVKKTMYERSHCYIIQSCHPILFADAKQDPYKNPE